MICSFKKLSSKNLALLSVIRMFHPEKNIQIKNDPSIKFLKNFTDILIETLEIQNQKISGHFSIVSYLSQKKYDSSYLERFWWLEFDLQQKISIAQKDVENNFKKIQGEIQKKKIITNENLKVISKLLENNEFLDGVKFFQKKINLKGVLSETDVLTYVKLKQSGLEIKGFPKIAQWFKTTGTQVNPVVQSLLKEYGDKQQQSQIKKQEPPKKQQVKTKEEQKKQVAPKPQVTKVKDEFTPEYLERFNSLKVKRTNFGQEILPLENCRNVLITSALPYVNNVPHLGNIIGCVLSADVYARYCRLRGYNTLYICGTDEYGTATEVKAIQEGCTPQEICDKYFAIHSDIYKWFDIDFDYFGRTSTPIHTKITQDIFLQLHPQYTTTHTNPQTYCTKCTIFLADRYVSGICPHCAYDDARGDQCDACGKLLDPIELKNSKCAICKTQPEIRDTTHIFINLPTIQPKLEQWISKAQDEGKWSENSINVSKAWLKQGLKERCITRDLKWGTPVPLEEFKHKVFYVWFDAPIGYLSITGNFVKDWEKWWKNPQNVKLYQFMGKDNVPFHTVIFPSTLIGTKQNYTLLHRISTTEYLNYEDGKFSKSRGVGVFGDNIVSTGIPPEVIRYYLLINRPEKSDSIFTWSDFGNKNNSELLPNIGNLVNRTLKFVWKKYNQKVPEFSIQKNTPEDQLFISLFFKKFEQEFIAAIEATEIKEALKKAMELSSLVNKYIQDEKAWEKEQQESKRYNFNIQKLNRSDQILGIALCAIRLISAIFEPFMPSMSAKINFLLGFTQRTPNDDQLLKYVCESNDKVATLLSLVSPGQILNQPVPLFRSYTEEELSNWRNLYAGQQQK